MKIDLVVSYSQFDSRWAEVMLGFNPPSAKDNSNHPYNLYWYGCLVSCLAMVCKYYGKGEDPLSLNNYLKEKNGFLKNSGEYIYGSITKCYPEIKEKRVQTPSALTDGQIQEIKTALDNGYPVMLQIDYNPKTGFPDMHFVLCCDYNPNDENDLTIADPLGGQLISLKKYLGWFKPSARKTIEQYLIYEGPKPKESAGKTTIDKKEYSILNFIKEQWSKLLSYLELETDPNATPFEDAQRVIAGIKSRQTDLENQAKKALKDLGLANVEIANQKDKVANIEKDCQTQLKLKNAELSAQKQASGSIEKLRGQYEGTIEELRGELREAQKQGGLKDIEIASLKKEIESKKEKWSLFNKIENLIKEVIEKWQNK